MKQVKMIVAAVIIAASFGTTAMAQDKMAKETKMKEHKCTAACKDGKHAYAHGEKGHTCTDACKKAAKKA